MSTEVRTSICRYDAHVNQDQTSVNHGDTVYLRIHNNTNVQKRAFMHMNLPENNLSGATILSATLTMTTRGAWAGTSNLHAQRITASWNEMGITWTNQPAVSATNEATATVVSAGDLMQVNFDVTAMVQQAANGASWFGIRIHTEASGGGLAVKEFHSSEATWDGRKPTLVVEYSLPAGKPTDLMPSGEQAISDAAPEFDWNSDTPVDTQVQIDTTSDMASPIFDSGWVANVESGYDTAAAGSPPSLTNNTTYFWRVRIRDENATVSNWSDVAEFQRRTKGTLVITEPTNNGDNVNDATPTIEHTFSVRTQKEVRYDVFRNNVLVYTRVREPQTALSFTLPKNGDDGFAIIKGASGDVYAVRLRVWDTFDRVSIGNDNAYVEATRTFDFGRANLTEAANLTAATQDGHVHLTWTRGSAPNFFSLAVDGVIQEARIDPAVATTGGTGYEYDWYGFLPGVEHTIEIESVVTTGGVNEHSDNPPSTTHTWNGMGIWLADPTNAVEAVIHGQEAIQTTIGMSTATYMPLGRRDPIVTQDHKPRGYEGSVSGTLIDFGNKTAAEWAAILENMFVAIQAAPLQLIYGNRSFGVIITEPVVSVEPTVAQTTYSVSFDFVQVTPPWPG